MQGGPTLGEAGRTLQVVDAAPRGGCRQGWRMFVVQHGGARLGHDHPFSAPKVRPRTMCFWTKNAITSTGSVMMVDAAVRPPQFRESYETKLKMATGSVRVVLPAITSEKMKLFHDEMMPRIAVATIPGRARGRAIRPSTPSRVQ